jgi:hypothetical protein
LAQDDIASYPNISAHVAWLVDKESDGSFGLDMVTQQQQREVTDSALLNIEAVLPDHYKHLKSEIQKRLAAE